ncbi:lytic transglycosylase domain-containing protein [Xanthobacter agilis]|uniref:Soluble lytic murein transglycosylase-like protein n=1 Tax=Xanthobacter agilis TaxID=47492 RepID=A0ABU0LHQ8_XANAG|nr:lytic transglycosylase domain-containing protein [Xanthobacter agilis]MDQ0506654.1 soluble lytic murein transglycosylase-like protein [Xanthobacter agilis]
MTTRNLALSVLLTLLTANAAGATSFGTIPMRETPLAPKEAPKDATRGAPQPGSDAGKGAGARPSAPRAAKPVRKGGPPNICERELARASKKYNVPLEILYAVGLTESGYDGFLQPYTLYIEGKDYISNNLQDALKLFREANARGVQLIDIGCMQVNYYWHKEEFRSLEEMFNPRLNVEQAARFLQELRQRHGSWTMALARYNAGPKNTVGQHRYVCRVMKNLIEAGVGEWTPSAKSFCDNPPPKPDEVAPAAGAPTEAVAAPAPPSPAAPAPVSPTSSHEGIF